MPRPGRAAVNSSRGRAGASATSGPGDVSAGRLWLSPPPGAQHLAGWALLPLRVFLGVTFCFAGLQKLANPAFFRASSAVSIQSQLAGAARHSPIHSLLVSLGHVAVPVGLLLAFGELAAGLGTLVGLWARVAAGGGALISLGLFLSISFHSNPYYTGSDIVFFFAWLPLLVAGAGPLSADAALANLARRGGGVAQTEAADLQRRELLVKASTAACLALIGLIGGGIVAGVGRAMGRGSHSRSARQPTFNSRSGPGSTVPGTAPSTSVGSQPVPAGTRLGPASAVPVRGSAPFTDPASGDPALVVQPQSGTFLAFDAVCPHAGCTVQYSTQGDVFVCPCHGSQFNGRTGDVEVGPAQSGLTRIPIGEGSDGQLYAR